MGEKNRIVRWLSRCIVMFGLSVMTVAHAEVPLQISIDGTFSGVVDGSYTVRTYLIASANIPANFTNTSTLITNFAYYQESTGVSFANGQVTIDFGVSGQTPSTTRALIASDLELVDPNFIIEVSGIDGRVALPLRSSPYAIFSAQATTANTALNTEKAAGVTVNVSGITNGQVLKYNATTAQFEPGSDDTGGTPGSEFVTSNYTGSLQLTGIVTANAFVGNLTGDVTGTATTANVALVANDIATGIINNADLVTGSFTAITGVGTLADLTVTNTVNATAFVGSGASLTGITADTASTANFATSAGSALTATTANIALNAEKAAGVTVNVSGITNGQVLKYNATTAQFEPGESGATNAVTQNYMSDVTINGTVSVNGLSVAGTTTTNKISVLGGADLAELFDVKEVAGAKPGMVVVIDPNNPGKLMLSTRAYDAKVAGVISGANGIDPGLIMRQENSIADGSHPIALAGRVWVWCDASKDSIVPGDQLTTSTRKGMAMRVKDRTRAQGAILGKAMTSLDRGQGYVLVLITLQ